MATKTIKKPKVKPGNLFINNEWIYSGDRFDVINPATEEKITDVAQAGSVAVEAAVQFARHAFENVWKKTTPRERGNYLLKIADLLEERKEEFAALETMDNGKPIAETLNADLPLAIDCFRYYGGLADKVEGRTIPVRGDFHNYVEREPVGVVAQIIPWNFPLLMLAWKLGPALAMGCTVVLKPAEQTPLTALKFADILLDVGLPAGVVNILTGDGKTGELLANHKGIDKIAFTGSTEVGRLIGEVAGRNIKRCSLELGGKAPNIIFADADVEKAVDGIIASIFFNQGEVCCAGSRLFVEESIKDDVVYRLLEKVNNLVQGDPLDPNTQVGAQVSKLQQHKVTDYIIKGSEQGGKLLMGGISNPQDKGFFVKPTIIEATDDNICAREEIFGPVVTVLTFSDYDDLVERANDTDYGLSAGIWTKDVVKAQNLAKEIKAGTVWINTYNQFDAASPFGGYKDSGNGRELGQYAVDLYTEVKSTWVNMEK